MKNYRKFFRADPIYPIKDRMAAKILETHGTVYQVGQSRDVVGYAAGGTTEDYAYDPD